jgi:hypothetical protein
MHFNYNMKDSWSTSYGLAMLQPCCSVTRSTPLTAWHTDIHSVADCNEHSHATSTSTDCNTCLWVTVYRLLPKATTHEALQTATIHKNALHCTVKYTYTTQTQNWKNHTLDWYIFSDTIASSYQWKPCLSVWGGPESLGIFVSSP